VWTRVSIPGGVNNRLPTPSQQHKTAIRNS
jgi:hypothetical protein